MPLHKDPKRQFDLDSAAQKKLADQARKSFKKLVAEVLPSIRTIKEAFPGTDRSSVIGKNKAFAGQVLALPQVQDFLKAYFEGTPNTQNKAADLFRRVLFGEKPLNEGLETLGNLTSESFVARELQKGQEPLQSIPPEIRAFLPKKLVVEVDPDGNLKRITERFGNEEKTFEYKIRQMQNIVRFYNKIVGQVKKDLNSPDEVTRFCAIVTSIIMETGIRPGAIGNAANIRGADGEKILVETFGATTLGPDHVQFVRDNFVKIEFFGKKGTLNTAFLKNGEIIRILEDLVGRARAGGFKYIFRTTSGEDFDYGDLKKYFAKNFADIDPTDFRKLRAAETIFAELTKSQEALYARIREFAASEQKDLRERVLEAIQEALAEAIEKSREALSHKDRSETIESYLDPRITLQFLSRGTMAKTLHDAILDNRLAVQFDPMRFVEVASARAVAAKWVRGKTSSQESRSLREILRAIENALPEKGGLGVEASSKQAAVMKVLAAEQTWAQEFLEALAELLLSLAPFEAYIPKRILVEIDRALGEILTEEYSQGREASTLLTSAASKASKASRKSRSHRSFGVLDALMLLMEPFLTVLDLVQPAVEKVFGKGALPDMDEKIWKLTRLYRAGPSRLR